MAQNETWNPWDVDAGNISPGRIEEYAVYGDPDVFGFIGQKWGPEDFETQRSKIITGKRGFGKTFLLARRSALHRKVTKQTTWFHPRDGSKSTLTEVFETDLGGGIPYPHWLRAEASSEQWAQIWEIAILGFLSNKLSVEWKAESVFQSLFHEIHEVELRTDSGSNLTEPAVEAGLSWFLHKVVSNLPAAKNECVMRLGQLRSDATVHWVPKILIALHNIKKRKRVAIYIDNPDALSSEQKTDLWCNIQVGMVLAIWRLQRAGAALETRLQVYASVREEALTSGPNGVRHQDLQHTLGLRVKVTYSNSDLRALFEDRCGLTPPSKLALPDHTNQVTRFVGFETVAHHDRLNKLGLPYVEKAIDAILRHSRNVPREIVKLGNAIFEIPGKDRTLETVKHICNEAAKDNIDFIVGNSYPDWDNDTTDFLLRIEKEIVTVGEISEWNLYGGSSKKLQRVLSYLLREGLLGYGKNEPAQHKHFYRQTFRFGSSFVASANPQNDFLFVHPALKEWIRAKKGNLVPWGGRKGVIIEDGRFYESSQPQVTLGCNGREYQVLINQELVKSQGGGTTNPIRFLFLTLYGWKKKNGVPLSSSDINIFRSEIFERYRVAMPDLVEDQYIAQCNKINIMPLIKKFHSENSAEKVKADRRQTGFIANPTSGICFPSLAATEIYIDETEFIRAA